MTAPLVSIVTATFNAARELPFTVRSIAAQRGASFEWVVVDGGSSDGTTALLARNEPLVARWISEPDRGIYDAWNKGCVLARGDWLLFVGAGDELVAEDTLARLAPQLAAAHPAHDLVYGKLRYISSLGRRDLDEAGTPWEELRGRWQLGRPALPPHGALFHHRSLFEAGRRFDPRFRIAGDAEFLLRHAMRKPPLFVPLPLLRAPLGGVSMDLRNARAMAREIAAMNRELGIAVPLRHRVAEALLLAAKVAASRMPGRLGAHAGDLYRRVCGLPERWTVR